MSTLKTVHWFNSTEEGFAEETTPKEFKWFLNNLGKDEISTSAYLPDQRMDSTWGVIGVKVKGRITLGANSMDDIVSGYPTKSRKLLNKWKSSGQPRRPGAFNKFFSNFNLNQYLDFYSLIILLNLFISILLFRLMLRRSNRYGFCKI